MGGGRRRGSPWRVAALLLVGILAAGGSGLLVAAFTTEPPRPPQPVAGAAPRDLYGPPPAEPERDESATDQVAMEPSVPVRIRIRAIGVDAKLISLGVDHDGEVEVPALSRAMDAGWYKYGPTPGELGNAVIIGHVDSRKIGPAVFFKLGKLKPGNTIEVVRKDRSVATFRVDGVDSFPKDEFPAGLVYGASEQANLRVVTCGGRFDKKARNYLDNVIVFATLEASDG
jgi:sortase (surface protein transpeptidase)